MTERAAFEVRLGPAVREYAGRVSSDLDPAELARRIVTAEPRRRGFGAGLARRPVAVPRLVWVLLVAALLTAMVAGMLLVGSQLQRKLPAVVPAFSCPAGSTPDAPGPVDQARPAFTQTVAFDRRAGRLVAVTTVPDGTATWTFDVCTNTWTRMHPDREPPSFQWARLVYDVGSDATILVAYGAAVNVWTYDLQTDTWTEKGAAATYTTVMAYDPRSGLVIAAADPLSSYDVRTDTWTPIPQASSSVGPGSPGGPLAYDASVDRIVAYAGVPTGGRTWLFDIRTSAWSRSDAVAPHVLDWLTSPEIAYDEAARRTVIGGNVRLAAYDATADGWETVEFPGPEPWHGVSLVYDPVNERTIVIAESWASWSGASAGIVAVDLTTREWTVLLEPSQGQPPQ